MHPSIPLMSGMHNKSQQSSHGVMIEVKSTGDSSADEVQVCQGLEFSDVRNRCKRSFEIKIITGRWPLNKPANEEQWLRYSSFRLMHPLIPLMSGMHTKIQQS
jgi:hypothetical protein